LHLFSFVIHFLPKTSSATQIVSTWREHTERDHNRFEEPHGVSLLAPTTEKRSATGHLKCSFRKTGPLEFQLGRSFVNLLEVVLGQLDVHRTEVLL